MIRELKWGFIIGGAGLLWSWLTCLVGWHETLLGLQWVFLSGYLVMIVGFVLAQRELLKHEPETSFREGVRFGAAVAGVVAVVAVLTQVGYFKFVNPGFTNFMVEESRSFYADAGLEGEVLEEQLSVAKKAFGLVRYSIQAALGAILVGVAVSAVVMGLVWRNRR